MARPEGTIRPIAADAKTDLAQRGIFHFENEGLAEDTLRANGYTVQEDNLYRREAEPQFLAIGFAAEWEGRTVWRVNVGQA